MEFKKKVATLLNEGPFISNSEGEDYWMVLQLPDSIIIKLYKDALSISINKLIDYSNDIIVTSILSFIFVTDRIICCMERHPENFGELRTEQEPMVNVNAQNKHDLILKTEEIDVSTIDYHHVDIIYHEIIKGGLDSNEHYTTYNEKTFHWNKYLNIKDVVEDLFLYGMHNDILRSSDEDNDDLDENEKKQMLQKKTKLNSKINEFIELIKTYKSKGLIKKYSPYSVKVPDSDCFACDEYEDEYDENNIDDQDILDGYKEPGTNNNRNDGMSIQYSNHYVVFDFVDNTKIAIQANIAWT